MASSQDRALQILEEIEELMKLRGENPFKIRAFEKAQNVISELPPAEDLETRAKAGTLTELPGIGKGISEVLTEWLLQGRSTARDELRAAIPPGLLELTRIPGLGPKKAQVIIDELGITTLGELEYACRENRILKLKGFGEKAQAKILESLLFLKQGEGQQRLPDGLEQGEAVEAALRKAANSGRHPALESLRVSAVGELRRQREVMRTLEFLVEVPPGEKAPEEIRRNCEAVAGKAKAGELSRPVSLPVVVHYAPRPRYGYELARLTSTPEHWQALGSPAAFEAADEEAFFAKLDLPVIPPESRETGEEVALARAGWFDDLLPEGGVQGVFHNHTTRSDGMNSVEQMVIGAKELGFKYIGISDHSQSAFYAQGLKVPDLLEQEREIREVQEKHPDIRVFWGIESDILQDGSLDYESKVLGRFDFVVASIHSRFGMDGTTMTDRILEAVRNPATRFLGHATGRLLLGRPAYACDLDRIIEEAARHDVAIEINANPHRLDIDWRWGPKLRATKARVAINPDAHSVGELANTRFGVTMARKALLPTAAVVNARSVRDVDRWLRRA